MPCFSTNLTQREIDDARRDLDFAAGRLALVFGFGFAFATRLATFVALRFDVALLLRRPDFRFVLAFTAG
jgi:hypothetical protein